MNIFLAVIVFVSFLPIRTLAFGGKSYYPYRVDKEQAFPTMKKGALAYVAATNKNKEMLLGIRLEKGRFQLIGFSPKSYKILFKRYFRKGSDLGNTGLLYLEKYRRVFFRSAEKLFSFHIDTKEFHQLQLNKETLNTSKHFFCHTELTYNAIHNYLIWGCSPDFKSHGDKISYGKRSYRSGFIMRARLSDKGKLIPITNKDIFLTSSDINGNKFSGISTGVWNTGGPLAITKSGNVVVTTGNGPSYSSHGNYGCSILLLEGKSFQLLRKNSFYSLDDLGTQECFFHNKDFSSSSPIIFRDDKSESKENEVVLVTGKPGRLIFFKPKELSPELDLLKNSHYLSHGVIQSHYGMPLILNKNGRAQVFTVGTVASVRERELVVLTEEQRDRYTKQSGIRLKQVSCFGYLKKSSGPHRLKADLYYTGKIRDLPILALSKDEDILLSPVWKHKKSFLSDWGTELYNPNIEWLESPERWSPFIKLPTDSGYFFNSPSFNNKENELLSYLEFRDCQLEGENCLSQVKGRRSLPSESLSLGFIILERNIHCSKNKKRWLPLYSYRKELPKLPVKEVLMVQGFDWLNQGVSRKWTYQGEEGERSLNTNHILFNNGVRDFILVFSKLKQRAYATILNPTNGDLIQKLPIPGFPHFNKPIVVNGEVFITTKERGLFKLTRL